MSTHTCLRNEYHVCIQDNCHQYTRYGGDKYDRYLKDKCDRFGCSYNPYRMGVTDFYGAGKVVDTTRKFTYCCILLLIKVFSLKIRSVCADRKHAAS